MFSQEKANQILYRYTIMRENTREEAKQNAIPFGYSGSSVQFNIGLALIGYPFADSPDWMDEEYKEPLLSEEEFDSDTYDNFLSELHMTMLRETHPDYKNL